MSEEQHLTGVLPISKLKEVIAFYDSHNIGTGMEGADLIIDRLSRTIDLNKLSGKTVVDIGCGNGFLPKRFKDKISVRYVGMDISSNALKAVRKHEPQMHVVIGCAEHLPFKSEKADMLLCIGALEHFLNMQSSLAEMRRVANKDAYIIIQLPNRLFSEEKQQIISRSFSLDESIKMLRDNGLLICDIEKYNYNQCPIDMSYEHIFICKISKK